MVAGVVLVTTKLQPAAGEWKIAAFCYGLCQQLKGMFRSHF
jgi:hypothetical protein